MWGRKLTVEEYLANAPRHEQKFYEIFREGVRAAAASELITPIIRNRNDSFGRRMNLGYRHSAFGGHFVFEAEITGFGFGSDSGDFSAMHFTYSPEYLTSLTDINRAVQTIQRHSYESAYPIKLISVQSTDVIHPSHPVELIEAGEFGVLRRAGSGLLDILRGEVVRIV